MMHIKAISTSIAFLILLSVYPQQAAAEDFTGKQFLEWPRDSQVSLITYSITMTAIVASQGRKDISHCLDDWYPLDPEISKSRQDFIIKIISENTEYHPQGVILAVLQKQCGAFFPVQN